MLSVRNRGDPKLPYPIRSLWMPIWDMEYRGMGSTSTVTRMEMTRIAIGLRLWLRRAIKRINDRYVARIVQYLHHVRVELALSEMEIG